MTSRINKSVRGGLLALLTTAVSASNANSQEIRISKEGENTVFTGSNLVISNSYTLVSTTNLFQNDWQKWNLNTFRFPQVIATNTTQVIASEITTKDMEWVRLFNTDEYYGPVSEVVSHSPNTKIEGDTKVQVNVHDITPIREVSLYVINSNGNSAKIGEISSGDLSFGIRSYLFPNGTNAIYVKAINTGFFYEDFDQNKGLTTFSSTPLVFDNPIYLEDDSELNPKTVYSPVYVSKEGPLFYTFDIRDKNQNLLKRLEGYSSNQGPERHVMNPVWDLSDGSASLMTNQTFITTLSPYGFTNLTQNLSQVVATIGVPPNPGDLVPKFPIVKTNYFDPGIWGNKYYFAHQDMRLDRRLRQIEDYLVTHSIEDIHTFCVEANLEHPELGLKGPYNMTGPFKYTDRDDESQSEGIMNSIADEATSGVYATGHGNSLSFFDNSITFDEIGYKAGNSEKQVYVTNSLDDVMREVNYNYGKRFEHVYYSTCDSASGPAPHISGSPPELDQISSPVYKTAFMGYPSFCSTTLGSMEWDEKLYQSYFKGLYPISYCISLANQEYSAPVSEWGLALYGYPDVTYRNDD